MIMPSINKVYMLLLFTTFMNVCFCEPGKACDPNFYDKSDALDNIYKTLEGANHEIDEFKIAKNEMDKNLSSFYHNTSVEEKEKSNLPMTKPCSGLEAPYLICNPDLKFCSCKVSFPFNNTEIASQCIARAGSVCAVTNVFQIPCDKGLICEKEGIKEVRFCGGITAYKLAQREAGVSGTNTYIINLSLLVLSIFASFATA